MTSLVLLFSGIASGFMFFGQLQNRRVLSRLDAREGFYASELAAWYRAENQIAGNTNYAGGDGTGSGVPLTLDYTQGTRTLAGTSYNGSSYNDGDPINVVTTDGFLPSHSFIRRDTGNNVHYYAPTAGSAYCGEMNVGRDPTGYQTCLSGAPSSSIPPFCSTVNSCWNQATFDCTADPITATRYNNLKALPPQPITSQADFINITDGNSYILKNDITLDGTYPNYSCLVQSCGSFTGKNHSNILLNGGGHTISITTAGSINIFGQLDNSIVQNVIFKASPGGGELAVNISGASCLDHVGFIDSKTSPMLVGYWMGWGFDFSQYYSETAPHLVLSNVWRELNKAAINCSGNPISSPGLFYKVGVKSFTPQIMVGNASVCGNAFVQPDSSAEGTMGGLANSLTGNTTISNSYFVGNISTCNYSRLNLLSQKAAGVGGLIGSTLAGTVNINGSGFYGTISQNLTYAGGLVGTAGGTVNVTSSWVSGSPGSLEGYYVGGVASLVTGKLNVSKTAVTTNINIHDGGAGGFAPTIANIGGVIGWINNSSGGASASIQDSFYNGLITELPYGIPTTNKVAGLVGYVNPANTSFAFNNIYVTSPSTWIGPGPNFPPGAAASVFGSVDTAFTGVTATATKNFYDETTGAQSGQGATAEPPGFFGSQSNFTTAGWDFTNTWQMTGSYPTLRSINVCP